MLLNVTTREEGVIFVVFPDYISRSKRELNMYQSKNETQQSIAAAGGSNNYHFYSADGRYLTAAKRRVSFF